MDDSYDASLLNHIDEIQLIKYMTQFPEIIEIAYINLEPQIIANYLQDLSSYFHKFYNHCRVITNNIELTKSRIALVKAVKVILKNGFSILGISVGIKWEKVQEKFKKLVKKFHPDMNAGNKKFEDKLKIITLAYTQLKNTYRKKN